MTRLPRYAVCLSDPEEETDTDILVDEADQTPLAIDETVEEDIDEEPLDDEEISDDNLDN